MPITKLKTDIDKVSHIIHVADIHIRLTKRHEEYKLVFDKLYEDVRNSPKNSIVCVLGDIFHNKSELSPECIQSAKEFLWNLAESRPVILIAGNHDATLTNRNRLDSLSPLVEALNHPNIHYLRESGLYSFANILFNNMSVFDEPDKYLRWKDIPTIYKNSHEHFIALFHGPVNNALTDLGYAIVNKCYPLEMFDGHTITLLGDIHMKQDLQLFDPNEGLPFVHYAGSLIQQNHGEELEGHGYSMWDLQKVSYTHVEIPNDYGHFTIDVEKGKLNTDISKIPKKARLRIRCFESIATEVKAVLTSVRKVCDITDVVYVRVSSPNDTHNKQAGSILSGNLSDVSYQNKLITDYLKKNLKVSDKNTIENVLKVNTAANSLIKKDEFSRNIRWKPKLFEFDNMFSYGEGNQIDFSKLSDVVGIFAANASGKSSILSALSFCIFDKCDRAYKASYILNNQKMSFRCKFNFEIDGVDYFIERSGKSDKKGTVPVTVKFWKEVNGEEIELHGEGRRDTNEVIRDYLGSYDDFILTALSVQNVKNTSSFIDMGHSERKDLLSQFIGLTVFDRLHNIAYEKHKELSYELRQYKNDDFTKKLVELRDAFNNAQSSLVQSQEDLNRLNTEREIIHNEMVELSKGFVKIDAGELNIKKLEADRSSLKKGLDVVNQNISVQTLKSDEFKKKISILERSIQELLNKDVENAYAQYLAIEKQTKEAQNDVEKKRIEIKNKLEKLEKLSKHEYDPNCKFCMNNIFVKDAIRTKNELIDQKTVVSQLLNEEAALTTRLLDLKWTEESHKRLLDLRTQHGKLNKDVAENANALSKNEKEAVRVSELIKSVENSIELYHQNQKDIESNQMIQEKVNKSNSLLKNTDQKLRDTNNRIVESTSQIALIRKQMEDIKQKVENGKRVESDYEAYNLYIQSVGRDGIPYEVISSTVPEIEREVNSILSQIVEFSIELESDGKNITPFIVYDKNKWALELSSGLERFISALAIRVALINISNLPRPNFLTIDEGFGCADADNLAAMNTLFAYLKTNFDFVLIVSHLDALKDMVDKHIEIKKENGFSKVIHT